MDGPEEDDPLFCSSMWTLEVVLSAAVVFFIMEGVWLTIYVRRCTLEACDGMGVAWSLGDYSYSPLAHRDEFHGVVHSSMIYLRYEHHQG
jgi:hypothetical protein